MAIDTRWRQLWRGLAVTLALCAGATTGFAQPLILSDEPSQTLAGSVEILEDPVGAMDLAAVQQADAAGRFQAQPGGNVVHGFTDGAFWVRFSVANPAAALPDRWFSLDNALIATVTLHVIDAAGASTTVSSGANVHRALRPLPTGRLLFPVSVAPGATRTVYMRLSGPMPIVSGLALWQPASYAEHEWRRMVIKALLVAGALTALILISVYFWKINRRWQILAIGVGDALFAAATFMVDGIGADVLPPGEALWQGRASGILILIALCLNIEFGRVFLDLPRTAPLLARTLRATSFASLLAAGMECLVVAPKLLTFEVPLALCAVVTVVFVLVALHGIRNAGLYAATWVGVLAVLVAVLGGALAGWNSAVYASALPVPSFVLSCVIMAYVMYREVSLAAETAERAHLRLGEFQRTEQERLAVAVEQRTRELRQAKAEAEEAGNARLSLLSTVSHELRTPLHTILGYAQLLRRKGGRREADAKLATIESSGLQLLHLIDEILEFIRGSSHMVALRPSIVTMTDLVRQIADTGRVLAVAGSNRFDVRLGDGVPRVIEVDEHRLLQILGNLISNGCKYTARGQVILSIERCPDLAADEPADLHRIRFAVEDTGIGIPADQLQKIFEPFSRATSTPHQPGIGLGLAIASQIVRAMGGEIEVTSELGRGSRFWFEVELPEVSRESENLPVDLPRVIGHVGPRRTLLIADDIAENREFLSDLCCEWGFDVLVAEGGAEALRLCREDRARPDCVLVDQFMPGMDGWAFLRELRTDGELRRLPVILVSAAEPARPAGMAPEIAFDFVLLKPIRQQDLANALRSLLDLEWILDQSTTVASEEPVAEDLPRPQDLAELRDLLALGQVVAIRRWAVRLGEDNPGLAAFGAKVARHAEAVDLAGLAEILDHAEKSGIKPPA